MPEHVLLSFLYCYKEMWPNESRLQRSGDIKKSNMRMNEIYQSLAGHHAKPLPAQPGWLHRLSAQTNMLLRHTKPASVTEALQLILSVTGCHAAHNSALDLRIGRSCAYLLSIKVPQLHAVWQDGMPVLQDVLLSEPFQQAPHLYEILIPAGSLRRLKCTALGH